MPDLYVDGSWVSARAGGRRTIECPADGTVVAEVDDLCGNLGAAQHVFGLGRQRPAGEQPADQPTGAEGPGTLDVGIEAGVERLQGMAYQCGGRSRAAFQRAADLDRPVGIVEPEQAGHCWLAELGQVRQ